MFSKPENYYPIDPKTGRLDCEKFQELVSKKRPKVMVFCSPGNPTGNVLNPDEMAFIVQTINNVVQEDPSYSPYLFSDETYSNMRFDNLPLSFSDYRSTANFPILMFGSASKGMRMYGERIGWLNAEGFDGSERLLDIMERQNRNFALSMGTIAQSGVTAALDHPEEVEQLRNLYRERRDYAMSTLTSDLL